ncbi:MAG: hypothetical protein HQ546_05785 [Planctomycetes bacterium]|nr:hypothetical protein [Planctomycetota bacterium]
MPVIPAGRGPPPVGSHYQSNRQDWQQVFYAPGLRVRRDGDAVVVHIPMRLRHRNGRQMILTDGESPATVTTQCDANHTLIEAIAKAHRWQEQLESGEYAGVEDLAQALGVDRTYVGRMLRLTSLAPNIIEAVLRGDEPEGISLEKLRKSLPVRWDEQRKVYVG